MMSFVLQLRLSDICPRRPSQPLYVASCLLLVESESKLRVLSGSVGKVWGACGEWLFPKVLGMIDWPTWLLLLLLLDGSSELPL